MLKNVLFLVAIIICGILSSSASTIDTVFFQQKELFLISEYKLISEKIGSEKKQQEKRFQNNLMTVLKHPGSEEYDFDSLSFIGRVLSDDKKVIVFSWNIPQSGGYHNYYCIIQHYNKKEKRYITTVLTEKTGFINQNPQNAATTSSWPGALYYKVITRKHKGHIYYTLIGYDFNDLISNRKVIEIISIEDHNTITFPAMKFSYEGKMMNRLVFEYAERVQMVIDYDTKKEMIILDHLSPFKPSLEGKFQFYGPDFSYDGFKFEDGVWQHYKDISPSL